MIKKHTILAIMIVACLLLLFSACSSKDAESSRTERTDAAVSTLTTEAVAEEFSERSSEEDIFSIINESEYIELSDVYNQINNLNNLTEEENALYQKLGLLKNCSGRFVQQSEDSGNRYTADVTFYLVKGEVFCSIDYTGYMGEILDGLVLESPQNDYCFEAFPKGDLYGSEQDFKIYFGNEKLYISWADVCEYTLTRGDGSADSVQEHRENLEESGLLDTLISVIDRDYADFEHRVVYDESSSCLNIYIQGLDNLRTYLVASNSGLADSWKGIVDNAATLSGTLYDAVHYYVDHVYVYWVDTLKNSDTYAQSEILLKAENGAIRYNITDENSITHSPDKSSNNPKPSSNPYLSNNSTHSITSGERNALEAAKNYLSFMAFSYSGLIEQLKYEGYSTSEAEYAADHCGADWNQQAVKKAKEYLDFMSFSRSGLIDQLEYEGFTHSQAVYGVDRAY